AKAGSNFAKLYSPAAEKSGEPSAGSSSMPRTSGNDQIDSLTVSASATVVRTMTKACISEQQAAHIEKVMCDVIGLRQLFGLQAARQPNGHHAGGLGRANANGRIFDGTTVGGFDADLARSSKVDFRVRLVIAHGVAADGRPEMRTQA